MGMLLPLCLANFAVLLMISAVGVALPAMQQDLGGSAVLLGWVEGAYTLSLAMAFVPVARVVDIWGFRRMFRLALVVFVAAGVALAASPSLEWVIAVRSVQAVAGATLNTAALSMLAVGVSKAQRGAAMGWFVASIYAGIAAGPLLGGFLVQNWGWRSVFAVSVPLVATAWGVSSRIAGEWRPRAGQRVDGLGVVLYAGSVGTWLVLLASVDNVHRAGPLAAAAVLLSWWFVRRMRTVSRPLVDLRALVGNRTLIFSLLATGINYASVFCVGFLLSLFTQIVWHFSPMQAGLVLVIPPVVQSLGSPWAGRFADRVSAPLLASAGMAVCAAVLAALAFGVPTLPVAALLAILAAQGVGFALFSSPNMTVILGSVRPEDYAIASSLTGAFRTFGMAVSMAGITVVFRLVMGEASVHAAGAQALVTSMRTVLSLAAVLSVAGVVLSLGRVPWRR